MNYLNYIIAAISAYAMLLLPLQAERSSDEESESSCSDANMVGVFEKSSCDTANILASLQAEALAEEQAHTTVKVDATAKFSPDTRKAIQRYFDKEDGWDLVDEGNEKLAEATNLPKYWRAMLVPGSEMPNYLYVYTLRLPDRVYDRYEQPANTEDVLLEDKIYRLSLDDRQIIDYFRPIAPEIKVLANAD